MVLYMKEADARRNIPNFEDYPSIDKSGSLRGMKKQYGWDTKYVIQVGSYYYYLKGYEQAHRYL